MHYLIDGYNYIFRLYGSEPDLRQQREVLLADLALLATHLPLTVVFDAHHHPEEENRGHRGAIEVVFTDPGESADTYILNVIQRAPRPQTLTVVTSDKHLARRAKALGGKSLSNSAFSRLLKPRLTPPQEKRPISPSSEFRRWLDIFTARYEEDASSDED